jgi:hypothetical protein
MKWAWRRRRKDWENTHVLTVKIRGKTNEIKDSNMRDVRRLCILNV